MSFKVGEFSVGGERTFIVAELSCNHVGKLDVAIKTIEAASKAGADAIKLQTYTADTMTLNLSKPPFLIDSGSIWDGRTYYDLYKEAHTPWEWHAKLKDVAQSVGLEFFSTPFDKSAVDFLEDLGSSVYKISSFEITDHPLIRYVASKGKPVIFSTGIAELRDIQEALEIIRSEGVEDIALLKCTSAYPAPLAEMNLRTMVDYKERFDVIPGLSDHTLGTTVPVVAVSLGAKVIEKHFILDKSLGGPDVAFSLDPGEFEQLVRGVRDAEEALGQVSYELTEKARSSRAFSRSLFAAEDIAEGEVFTEKNVRSVRPGSGLHPRHYEDLLGKKAKQAFLKGQPLAHGVRPLAREYSRQK